MAPKLSLTAAKRQAKAAVLKSGVAVRVSCNEACGVLVFAAIPDARGRVKMVGGQYVPLRAGFKGAFGISLTKAGRKLVTATTRNAKITLSGVAIDSARNRGRPRARSATLVVPVAAKTKPALR